MKILVLTFLLSCLWQSHGKETDQLLGVVIMYRHGDRTPTRFYPKDPYQDSSFWKEGPGQLTNQGKQRHYELGQWFRNRYSKLLPEKYSKEDFHISSTDVDRTLMSAASNLAGLYPPHDKQIWNENLLWQPIPIHITPRSIANEDVCPKFDKIYAEVVSKDPFSTLDAANLELYEYITNNTGKLMTNFEDVSYIYDTLYIEYHNNLSLPAWTQSVFPDEMKPMADAVFMTCGFNDDLSRYSAGPFFYTVIEQFEKLAKGDEAEKMLVFSAHDVNVASVLGGLQAFEPHTPYYASSVMIELRQKDNGDHIVNVLYKNSTEAKEVEARGCNFDCLLDDFKFLLSNISISSLQWNLECYL